MKVALIVLTRLPQAGTTKTRLIPALGPEGAADLQRRLTLHHVGRAAAFAMTGPDTSLIISHAGGTRRELRAWLGPWRYIPQAAGDLGQRLHSAISDAHLAGAGKILVTGSDCPALRESHFAAALEALDEADLVLAPAEDGGYTMIGLRRPEPYLFENMSWSTASVLQCTLDRAREDGLSLRLLETLPDVDEPSDLPAAEETLTAARRLSVIVPARNEPLSLAELIPRLLAGNPHEIIIADGGNSCIPESFAADPRVTVIPCPPGRARQMNLAAARATGDYLLFLHADTIPPAGFPGLIAATLGVPGVAAGAFCFALRESFPGKTIVETLTRLRGHLFQMPYGDQGLFLRRSVFEAVGGFTDWPVLEDVDLVKRLRRIGRVVIITECAPTSARRWQRGGLVATWLRHQLILAGHALGVPPERLAKLR